MTNWRNTEYNWWRGETFELELEVASIQMNEDDVVDGEESKFAYLNPLLMRSLGVVGRYSS